MPNEGQPREGDSSGPWKFPGQLPSIHAQDESDEPDSPWVDLVTIATTEVKSLCARLEREGVPSTASSASETESLVRVPEDLIESARTVLENPPDEDEEEAAEFDREREERLARSYVCPRCHKKRIALLPTTPNRRLMIKTLLAVVLLPFAIAILEALIGAPLFRFPPDLTPWLFLAWVVSFLALVIIYVTAPRRRRCLECGWEGTPE